MDRVRLLLRHYADFSGRAPRREYWLFVLFLFLLFALTVWLDSWLPTGGVTVTTVVSEPGYLGRSTITQPGWITRVTAIAEFVPLLAVTVRRLHDIGRSGWWLLATFVPLFGAILLLVFFLTGGERRANRFGPDPLAKPEAAER